MVTVEQTLENLRDKYQVIDTIWCDKISYVDLYHRIQTLHRDIYQDHERLVFVITTDSHYEDQPGITLQYLQSMICEVDISNFFVVIVTTNTNIHDDYEKVFRKLSIDLVPCHLELCQGEYMRSTTHLKNIAVKKYSNLKDNYSSIGDLTDVQKSLLFDSEVFCILPWMGIHISPTSEVRVCCESTDSFGSCRHKSINELWNSDVARQTRQKMLSEIPVESCVSCYTKEKLGRQSLRQSSNERFLKHVQKVDFTDTNGYLHDYDLKYWDIRYNNLCNLSCRSCSPSSSSSWYQAALYLGHTNNDGKAIKIAGRNTTDIFDQIMEHIYSVESIYFAGGEPLIIEEFYQILEKLIDINRTDVKLIYNTNLTRLKLKSWNVLDIWKHFPSVAVGASLDGEYLRGEYIREGTIWDDVVHNREKMLESCPHIDFYISATASILNVLHLPDFHRSWVDKGLIGASDFNIQLLFSPEWMRVDAAPGKIKALIERKYLEHLDWLGPLDHFGRSSYGFLSMIEHIKNHREFGAEEFWHNINSLDKFYDRDFAMTFPELTDLPRL